MRWRLLRSAPSLAAARVRHKGNRRAGGGYDPAGEFHAEDRMAEKRSLGSRMSSRLGRWEVVLAMAFLIDLFEDKFLFPAPGIPSWGKVLIKMGTIVGLFGVLLSVVNKQMDLGLAVARGAGEKTFVPRIVMHALLLGALFVGIHWLKIGRLPW